MDILQFYLGVIYLVAILIMIAIVTYCAIVVVFTVMKFIVKLYEGAKDLWD